MKRGAAHTLSAVLNPTRLWSALLACVFALTLFTLMVFLKGHEAYQLTGHPNGIQGRYLYPFIPLTLASVGIALGRLRHGATMALAITVVLCWAHLNAYLGTIIPFYEWVAL